MDELALYVGRIVIGTVAAAFWFGGAIAGGDYVGRQYGKRAGDWFGLAWFFGLPLAAVIAIFVNA